MNMLFTSKRPPRKSRIWKLTGIENINNKNVSDASKSITPKIFKIIILMLVASGF